LFPYGGAYDPVNQEVYIANYGGDNVTVLNGTTGHHVTDISTGTMHPTGVAYVSSNGYLYVIIETNASVDVVAPATNTIRQSIALAGEPEYEAYDPDNEQLYMTVWTSSEAPIGIQAVNTSTNTVKPVVPDLYGAYCLAVDSRNDTIWAENLVSDNITVISGGSDRIVRSVSPGPQPTSSSLSGGIAYSSVGDQMFFVNYASSVDTTNVVGASNYSLLASGISVGARAFGASVTYDPASECMYVASYYTNTITVISAVNDSTAEPAVTRAGGPWVGIYDPTTGDLFFLLSASNGAAWIFGGIAAVFTETGLPSGTSWNLSVNGTIHSSRGSTMSFVEAVGAFEFSVFPRAGYEAAPLTGTLTVPSSPVAPVPVSLRFEFLFLVQFVGRGLPTGAQWIVHLNGTQVNESTSGFIGFREPNGSYPYTVETPYPGYGPIENASGAVNVVDDMAEINVTFGPTSFEVTFTESGLASGTVWWVNVTGGGSNSSEGSTLSLVEPNGFFNYTVASANKSLSAPGGEFEVRGGAVEETVSFSLVTYSVTFTEAGLPSGSLWSVTLSGATQTGTADIVFVGLTNGTRTFTVGVVTGYDSTPNQGTVTTQGTSIDRTISFQLAATSSSGGNGSTTFLGLPATEGYVLLGVVVAVIVVGLVLAVFGSRRGRTPSNPA
jgi:DNA-binding beta-propeller fold protein YncE